MKVAVVAPYFYPRLGGAEVYTLNITRQLRALGWTVFIVTTGQPSSSVEQFEDMNIYRLKTAMTLSNTPVGLGWRRQLRRIFREERPDVINAHTPVPYLSDLAERASGRIPFVLTYHNDLDKDLFIMKIAVQLAHAVMIKRTLRRSKHIITTSAYYVDQSRYLSALRPKISIVPPGVDLATFHPRTEAGTHLTTSFAGKRVVLFVGSLAMSHQHKGLGVLIRAFSILNRELSESCLVVVGSGNGLEMYKAQAVTAGVAESVRFTGRVSDEELAQYYALADVLAVPSTNRSEGFGMVFIEAGAVGTPVIGSRVGGVPYAIKDGETGILVEPKSVESLHAALRRILDDGEFADRLGAAGAERVRREFDWRVLARATSDVLTQVTTSGGLPSMTALQHFFKMQAPR